MGTPWVSFNGKDCSGCKYINDRGYCEFTACIIPCTVIATIPEVKPKTNADRIRSMTDEELCSFIGYRKWCTPKTMICSEHKKCIDCLSDWLKQEAEEGE